jgi:hypothetical protein
VQICRATRSIQIVIPAQAGIHFSTRATPDHGCPLSRA